MRIFWLLPLLLFLAQLVFTLGSTSQIRYEELAESARNPFWMQSRLVYDGVSTSVWWYLTQIGVYNIFGYDIFTTKIFRLVLHLVSLFALAGILRRFLGEKKAVLPLVVVGFSPSLLFLNTLETSYGTDLQYLPIVLFLLTSPTLPIRLMGLMLSMVAWLTYPPFVFYLPALFLLLSRLGHLSNLRNLSFSLFAFLAPLVFAYFYIQNRSIFIFDPQTQSGVFRGAGASLSFDNFPGHISGFITDFFERGDSYHFEVFQAEFSQIYPMLSFFFVFAAAGVIALKYKKWQAAIFLTFLTLFLAFSVTGFSGGLPGMRRYTPILAVFYALFSIVWLALPKLTTGGRGWIGRGLLLIVLVHHIVVYPINLAHLKDLSPYAEQIFFGSDPRGQLAQMAELAQKEELKLACVDERGQAFFCRYNEVWAAVAGYCFWNKLSCNTIYGFDIQSNKFIPLGVNYRDEYY